MKKSNIKLNPFVIIVVLAFIFVYLFEKGQGDRMRYSLTQLQNQYDNILAENDDLDYKITKVLSQEHINTVIRDKKLIHPDTKSIVVIE
ncbi:MAG: hypothetical protein LBN20_02120 [Endomicrobium sp.]|jgi:hypothetical protein|nr:hypothetical protein [Endomicrobium sp.]